MIPTRIPGFYLRPALEPDISLILSFIRELAEYEKLTHEVVATEELLRANLFGERRTTEVLLAFSEDAPVGFAVFFTSFSTFLGRPGIYLEDVYVKPEVRGRGYGTIILAYLAHLARERGCGRLEWSVLDWNEPALQFYRSLGARPMDEWIVQRVTGTALETLAARF